MLLLISIERAGIRGTCRAEARMFSPLVRSLTSLPVGLELEPLTGFLVKWGVCRRAAEVHEDLS
jgi:hypothetical protein